MTARNPKKWFMIQLKVFCKGVEWFYACKKDSVCIWFYLNQFTFPELEVTVWDIQKQLMCITEFDVLGL